MLKKLFIGMLLVACQPGLHAAEANQMPCLDAIKRLVDGNTRFSKDLSIHPDSGGTRRKETAVKQKPFAVILGCSDSRVAPEIVFDQGIGDLFIIRTAGNVVGLIELDSIEYAAENLETCLIVVLGHENCGAVTAVAQGQTKDIEAIAELIAPAVKEARAGQGTFTIEKAIKTNIRMVVTQLQNSKVISKLISEGKVAVIGGYYHFETGEVEFLHLQKG